MSRADLKAEQAAARQRPSHRLHRLATALTLVVVSGSVGCWEQNSADWFPQMKRQLAVQAFEQNTLLESGQGLTPPEGTVVVGNPYPDIAMLEYAEQEKLQNPTRANLVSLKRGEVVFQRYCSTCHGADGGGGGPVAGPPFGTGPFGLVLPIGGRSSVARAFTDGHIYTTITLGRGRMPSYRRISPDDRWHVVNYIRDLNGQGGGQ